jgi:PKD repeat protein
VHVDYDANFHSDTATTGPAPLDVSFEANKSSSYRNRDLGNGTEKLRTVGLFTHT